MPEMTNPYNALVSFQHALDLGSIDLQPCRTDPDLVIHLDTPNGKTRMSHAYIEDGVVVALAMVVHDGFEDGLPCFDMGYAVHEDHRGRGLGRKIAAATAEAFQAGMDQAGVAAFHLEAVVGLENVASQHIAASVISQTPERITDSVSGLPAWKYSKLVR
jgi:GNAT superfamily N-acetyltransferase